MNKLTSALLAAAAATTVAAPQAAAQAWYLEGGYKAQNLEIDNTPIEVDLGSIYGRAGGMFNDYIGGEMDLGYGVKSGEIVGIEVKAVTTVGIYGVAQFKPSENISVFGRAGLAFQEIDVQGGGFGSDNGFGYGGGAKLFFNENTYIRADYTVANVGDATIDEIGISIGRSF